MTSSIKVRCLAPKYAKGEYQFSKFQDLFRWLSQIKGLPKGSIGAFLYGLAKDGFLNLYYRRYAFEIVSDFYDYFLARDVAFRVGLLKAKWGSDRFSKELELASKFAEELDKLTLDISECTC